MIFTMIDLIGYSHLTHNHISRLSNNFRRDFRHIFNYVDAVGVKVGLSPSKKPSVIRLIESPLKMMKNAFYFILKAFFIPKIFTFLSYLRVFFHVEKTT